MVKDHEMNTSKYLLIINSLAFTSNFEQIDKKLSLKGIKTFYGCVQVLVCQEK